METSEYKFPLVSVIMPVYNKEEYIEKCLDSAINQTYKNIEIICVNDCSTDKSLEILEKYAQKDSRIKIINNETRQRAGISRNIGIENSTGEYVFFLDSDDYIEKNCIESLTEYTQKYKNVDVVTLQYNFICLNEKYKIELKYIPDKYTDRLINLHNECDCIEYIPYSIGGLLIRKALLIDNSIIFKSYKALEDGEFTNNLLIHAKTLVFSPYKLYNYLYGVPNSVVTKRHNNIQVFLDINEMLKKHKDTLSAGVYDALRIKLYLTMVESVNEAYSVSKISYKELKYIYENVLDHSLFSYPSMDYCRVKYERFLKYNPFFYKLISVIIYYTKLYLPTYFSILVKIKKKLQKLKK
ncbi:MAG: glycosyltransferase family A protein [Candidatus Gastranaerophilaceae bacterium]|nr:glycosyltransferase family A protein [Candidatus Gastranaerophilaceae bacterium]